MAGKKYALLIVILLIPLAGFAVRVQKITLAGFTDFREGRFENILIDGEGALRLGPETTVIPSPEEEYFLSLDIDSKGRLLLGTGHEASVYRWNEKDPVDPFFRADHLDVYTLKVLADDSVLVGASPSGKLYRVEDDQSTVFFDPRERMIWDLAAGDKGTVYCAVGAGGGVYQISGDGTAEQLPAISDYHILSLYNTSDGRLLAGSGENGILFVHDKGQTRVLFDTPYREIKGITEDGEGNVYFSATMGGYPVPQFKMQENQKEENNLKLEGKGEKNPKKVFYSSTLYRADPLGVVEVIWKLKTEYIYDIHYSRALSGIVAATGNSGRTYLVEKNGDYSLLHRGDYSQAYQLREGKEGIYLITNNSASVVKFSYRNAQKGEYISKVFDMKVKSRIGHLYWNRGYEEVKGLSLMLRAGNTAAPDGSWTEWQGPYFDPEGGHVNMSGNRYFQIRVLLNDLNVGIPVFLKNISVYYLQANRQPILKSVKVSPEKKSKPPSDKLAVTWKAEDPNQDRLQYTLHLKPLAADRWMELEDQTAETEYTIDSRLFQDGIYQLRITADDTLDNPAELAKTTIRLSEPFLIDSTAPVVANFSYAKGSVTFTVIDRVSVVTGVFYSGDGESWNVVFPVDGICDSPQETFRLSANRGGYLFIKAIDEAGNTKVFQERLQ